MINLNPSAAGARDLRLLQAATKMLQLEQMKFDGCFWGNSHNDFYIYRFDNKKTFDL